MKFLILCGFLSCPLAIAMDQRIISIYDYFDGRRSGSHTPETFLSTAVQAFGVEEKDIFQKIIFGYFVDIYVAQDLEEAAAMKSYHMAGLQAPSPPICLLMNWVSFYKAKML